jgi:hypothetical protein
MCYYGETLAVMFLVLLCQRFVLMVTEISMSAGRNGST